MIKIKAIKREKITKNNRKMIISNKSIFNLVKIRNEKINKIRKNKTNSKQ